MTKTRMMISLVLVACGVGVALRAGSSAAVAQSQQVIAVGAAAMPLAMGDEEYSYVGSAKCKKCHIKQHKSWAKTKMAKSFDILKPGNYKEQKQKFNLDPAKDYTSDEKCVKCHTVGYGKPGGYAIPKPGDKKAARKAKALQGVGCECCHGPGSAYIKVFEEILKSKRKYKVEELYAAGLRKIEESTCTSCHNDESPSVNPGDPFDFEKRKDEGTHEHIPLKQREE